MALIGSFKKAGDKLITDNRFLLAIYVVINNEKTYIAIDFALLLLLFSDFFMTLKKCVRLF